MLDWSLFHFYLLNLLHHLHLFAIDCFLFSVIILNFEAGIEILPFLNILSVIRIFVLLFFYN